MLVDIGAIAGSLVAIRLADRPETGSHTFGMKRAEILDRKSTRLNSSHTEIYTLSLHDALPIYAGRHRGDRRFAGGHPAGRPSRDRLAHLRHEAGRDTRSEEHTSELQSHRDLHSFPTRRSSDLCWSTSGRSPVRWWPSGWPTVPRPARTPSA